VTLPSSVQFAHASPKKGYGDIQRHPARRSLLGRRAPRYSLLIGIDGETVSTLKTGIDKLSRQIRPPSTGRLPREMQIGRALAALNSVPKPR